GWHGAQPGTGGAGQPHRWRCAGGAGLPSDLPPRRTAAVLLNPASRSQIAGAAKLPGNDRFASLDGNWSFVVPRQVGIATLTTGAIAMSNYAEQIARLGTGES